jgi:5'-3' exonuclease
MPITRNIQKLLDNCIPYTKINLQTQHIKHIIFIDTSYYTFYRFHSLINWYKLSHPEVSLQTPIEEEDFVENFRSTFVQKLQEIPKKIGIQPDEKYIVCFGKDCPRKDIWRMTHYPKYKSTRHNYNEGLDIKNPGPFFKLMYKEELYKQAFPNAKVLFHPHLEADDCIALTVKYIQSIQSNLTDPPKITIFTSDNDYLQLINSDTIQIFNMQYKPINNEKTSFGDPKKDLLCKIIVGDTSDAIDGIFKRCGRKTAEKYVNDMSLFQKQIEKEKCEEKYRLNRLLIDFTRIPDDLQQEFYGSLDSM